MKTIQKILVIAIVGLFVGNAKGLSDPAPAQTVFDLPVDTPGLMPQKQNKRVCGVDKECVHVIVPKSKTNGTLIANDDEDNAIESALHKKANIYFPADGTHPTTPEAVEYSCANVDAYNINSPITEWYMKMFGVIPYKGDSTHEDAYIKAGYDKDKQLVRCISFDGSKQEFNDAFKQIASTSVGRVLLYRMLIEIRRHDQNEIGCFGCDIEDTVNVDVRNASRSVQISWGGNSFKETTINPGKIDLLGRKVDFNKQACINFDGSPKSTIVVASEDAENSARFLTKSPRTADIALFHEMAHWFHFLRYTSRLIKENSDTDANTLSKLAMNSIGTHYYSELDGNNDSNRCKVSAKSWQKMIKIGESCTTIVTYEEMRNILGMCINSEGYKNGDDLSENLYRLCKKTSIRFSHSDETYFEDRTVVYRAINVVESLAKLYNLSSTVITDSQTGDYDFYREKGIGACRRGDRRGSKNTSENRKRSSSIGEGE